MTTSARSLGINSSCIQLCVGMSLALPSDAWVIFSSINVLYLQHVRTYIACSIYGPKITVNDFVTVKFSNTDSMYEYVFTAIAVNPL